MKSKRVRGPVVATRTELQREAFQTLQDAGQMMICLTTARKYAEKCGAGGTMATIDLALSYGGAAVKMAAEAHLETLKGEV